jgi:hypothetical protein
LAQANRRATAVSALAPLKSDQPAPTLKEQLVHTETPKMPHIIMALVVHLHILLV